MAKQLPLKAHKQFLNCLDVNILRVAGKITLTAMLIFGGVNINRLWAQTFEIPEGFTSTIEHRKMDNGNARPIVKISPKDGNFTRLSSITLRPISEHITDPAEWLRDRMRLIIRGSTLIKEIFDDPDSPFSSDESTAMRDWFERSLAELSKLAEWPLKYCNKVTQGNNLAGAYNELVCEYSIGTITQHLVLRIQHADGLWYQTTIRTMNKRRLRHFLAIANSFHLD